MRKTNPNHRSEMLFYLVTAKPKWVITLGVLAVLVFASFLPKLEKDTRNDAFMPDDHPALTIRTRVQQTFGLNDPIVVAVVNDGQYGVFNPTTLDLVSRLTSEIQKTSNIDPDRVMSLATEKNITGTSEGMLVENFLKPFPSTQYQADQVKHSVMDFPLYVGSLVSEDGSATLIVAELVEQEKAQETYKLLLSLTDSISNQGHDKIFVAGEGAVAGYLGAYIDADAMVLNPLAALVISIICFIAFRTWRGMLLPNIVVLAAVGGCLGLMASLGVDFFVISNALPVVLIGISVADSLHILSQYYEETANRPDQKTRDIIVHTMCVMWRPITLTSMTTAAGFLGLSFASVMPPMKYFGFFASVGVGMAWLYSLTVVPAVLTLLKPQTSRAYRRHQPGSATRSDRFGRLLARLGIAISRHPIAVIAVLPITICLWAISPGIVLNEDLIRTFHEDEPIAKADRVLNSRFDGTHYLDILVETPKADGLLKTANLERIEKLQDYLETLPHVKGSTSLVDYLKQMNKSLYGNQQNAYRLPADIDTVAQYLLLYNATAAPDDFEHIVDYDYRLANVRVRMDDGKYSSAKEVVNAANSYIHREFNTEEINALVSGRVNVDYHWIDRLGGSHYGSIGLALLMVWLMASISFRSLVAGTLAVLPVGLTVLIVYTYMGYAGIWLSISSSMFAAISIGLGVDFSIHTLERMIVFVRDQGKTIDQAIAELYPSTGRALLFNFLALAFGFGTLVISKIVIMHEFGAIVAMAITTSFITSLFLLPTLLKTINPSFLGITSAGKIESIRERA
jgi:predicted RND superfamily exporter protein